MGGKIEIVYRGWFFVRGKDINSLQRLVFNGRKDLFSLGQRLK